MTARVRAEGRALEDRLLRLPPSEISQILGELREFGELGPTEEAALGPPGGRSWVRRLLALALARGDECCRVLLRVLASLEEPGLLGESPKLRFFNPKGLKPP